MIRLALYQPDIPQNTGTILRLAACLGVAVDIIEPCGFPWNDRGLRRAGLDYLEQVDVTRHLDWDAFRAASAGRRLVLLTTKATSSYLEYRFGAADTLLLGREGSGVPESVHGAVDARVTIPIRPETRSLNVALAAAMVLGEALRQTADFPHP